VAVAQVSHSCRYVSTGWGGLRAGRLMEVLTIAIEQRQTTHVFAVSIKRTHWRFGGLGESEAGREGVEREGNWGYHCIDAVGAVRQIGVWRIVERYGK